MFRSAIRQSVYAMFMSRDLSEAFEIACDNKRLKVTKTVEDGSVNTVGLLTDIDATETYFYYDNMDSARDHAAEIMRVLNDAP